MFCYAWVKKTMNKFLPSLGCSKVYLLLFPGIVMKSLLHGMYYLQILTTVKVNRVTTMEYVRTLSTITDVHVLRVSAELTVISLL